MPEIRKAGFGTLQPEVGSWEDGLPLSGKEYRKAYTEAAAEADFARLSQSLRYLLRKQGLYRDDMS